MFKFSKNSAELVYKTGQLASENFQFGPSVRHSQELLTLILMLQLLQSSPAPHFQTMNDLTGQTKEKLTEITFKSSDPFHHNGGEKI